MNKKTILQLTAGVLGLIQTASIISIADIYGWKICTAYFLLSLSAFLAGWIHCINDRSFSVSNFVERQVGEISEDISLLKETLLFRSNSKSRKR